MRTGPVSRWVVLALVFHGLCGEEAIRAADPADAGARFLAGIPFQDRGKLSASRSWEEHSREIGKAWAAHERSTLNPMTEWAAKEVAPRVGKGGVVRYFFSGPDILHALRMFPHAETYILCGLEPVGGPPDLDGLKASTAQTSLAQIRQSLGEVIQFGFFRTIDMKSDLGSAVFPGTVPIMGLFLVRSGHTIEKIEYVQLNRDGSLTELGRDPKKARGVRINFRGNAGRAKTLYYFSTNVSDGEVEKSGFLNFAAGKEAGASYLKAASYLLHYSNFSAVRNHLLAHSRVLVQDDSGVPYRHFTDSGWDVRLHGQYSKPIDLFAQQHQPDLRAAYAKAAPGHLAFGTGYRWRKNESNLLVAVKR